MKKRNGDAPTLVSGNQLAVHFGVVRQRRSMSCDGEHFKRRSDGRIDQDDARLKYLAHLRNNRNRSPRAAADAEFSRAKAEWLQMRVAKHRREHIQLDEAMATLDDVCGLFIVALNGLPAALFPFDVEGRRQVEGAVFAARDQVGDEAERRLAKLEGVEAWRARR